jgi:hypothetical protein
MSSPNTTGLAKSKITQRIAVSVVYVGALFMSIMDVNSVTVPGFSGFHGEFL